MYVIRGSNDDIVLRLSVTVWPDRKCYVSPPRKAFAAETTTIYKQETHNSAPVWFFELDRRQVFSPLKTWKPGSFRRSSCWTLSDIPYGRFDLKNLFIFFQKNQEVRFSSEICSLRLCLGSRMLKTETNRYSSGILKSVKIAWTRAFFAA